MPVQFIVYSRDGFGVISSAFLYLPSLLPAFVNCLAPLLYGRKSGVYVFQYIHTPTATIMVEGERKNSSSVQDCFKNIPSSSAQDAVILHNFNSVIKYTIITTSRHY